MSLASELRDFHGRWTTGGQGDKGASAIVKALKGKKNDDAREAIGRGRALDTATHHTDKHGEYSPEREALHQAITAHFMKHSSRQDNPEAIFTAGGAASGKSTLAGKRENPDGTLSQDNLPVPRGHVYVNPDDIKAMLPEYKALIESGRADIAAGATHEESSYIAKALTVYALEGHRHVIIDGTGNSSVEERKFAKKIQAAVKLGYKVKVRYAHVSVEEAIRREAKRALRTDRKVDESVLRHQHKTVVGAYIQDVSKIPEAHVQIYSTAGRGRPTLIADKPAHRPNRVINAQQFGEHLAKAVV